MTESPPRWILRTLLGISALFGLAILTVRTPGIIATAQLSAAQEGAAAAAAFARPVQPRNAPYAIDSVAWAGHPAMPYHGQSEVRIPEGVALTLNGWALDGETKAPFSAVYARVDRSPALGTAARAQLERPDVAAALSNPSARLAGFSVALNTTALPVGRHSIELRGVDSERNTAYVLGSTLALVVSEPLTAGQTQDAIDAINGVLLGAPGEPVRLQRSYRTLTLTGWGFLAAGPSLARGVSLMVDGLPTAAGRYGLLRSDVAGAFHDVRLAKSGFELNVAANLLSPGRHVLSTRFDAGNGTFAASRTSVVVVIE